MNTSKQLIYIELKTGFSDDGPAWISKGDYSQSGRTVYFDNKALKQMKDPSAGINHYDLETGEKYWISGVKVNGEDRHPKGGGVVFVDEDCLKEYLHFRGLESLNKGLYHVVIVAKDVDKKRFDALENGELL